MLHRISLTLMFCGVFFYLQLFGREDNQVDSVKSLLVSDRYLSDEQRLSSYDWLCDNIYVPEEILKYGTLALNLAERTNNLEYIIKGNKQVGVAHRFLGDLGKSLEYLIEAANHASGHEEFLPDLANIYAEISTCYTQNGDSENALLYGSKTIEILRNTDEKKTLALTLLNVGYDYYLIKNYDSALAYYNESEDILSEIDMALGQAYILGNRALVFWKKGAIDIAKRDLFSAIDMLQALEDPYALADYYNKLGNILLEEGDNTKAIEYTKKGLRIAEEEGLKEQVRDASYLLFLLSKEVGEFESATDYLVQHHAYKDSIQNLQTTQRLANLRTEYEVGQKQSEVDLLLEQRRSNRIIMIAGGITLVIVLFLGIMIYVYSKAKTKLNEELELQKDSLIKANQTKDKFFSIISHDLRGPVNMLSGLVSVTKYFVDGDNASKLKEMMGKMEESVDRLTKLLDNLLHWALQQSGHFPYVPEYLSVEAVSKEVTDIFSDMSESKNIKLGYDVVEDFNIYADKNATSTILRNLVNNAVKFTPNGGKVCIQATKDPDQGFGIIRVADSGVGIPNQKLKSIFSLGEKMSSKGTSGETGLGLGLQLVQDFVRLNKGMISVQSEEGQGTTFTLRLPLGLD